jgi:hypothetical protein
MVGNGTNGKTCHRTDVRHMKCLRYRRSPGGEPVPRPANNLSSLQDLEVELGKAPEVWVSDPLNGSDVVCARSVCQWLLFALAFGIRVRCLLPANEPDPAPSRLRLQHTRKSGLECHSNDSFPHSPLRGVDFGRRVPPIRGRTVGSRIDAGRTVAT